MLSVEYKFMCFEGKQRLIWAQVGILRVLKVVGEKEGLLLPLIPLGN